MVSNATIFRRVKRDASMGRPSIHYSIQLVDRQSFDDTVLFMMRHYLPRENLNKAVGSILNKETIEETKLIYEESLAEGISLAAFLEDTNGRTGKMIGCNILNIEKEDGTRAELSKYTEPTQRAFKAERALRAATESVFTLYKCSSIVNCQGLAVAPEYEGFGIGTEMLRAREELCGQIDIPVSASAFTGQTSQNMAARVGYQVLSELDLTGFRIDGQIVIPNPDWPILKWMAIRYF